MMMAVGCIQSQRCHTNRCPVGVATQDPKRTRALDVADKSMRAYRYHESTVRQAVQLMASMGVADPADLTPYMLRKKMSPTLVRSYAEIYEWLLPDVLIEDPPENLGGRLGRRRPGHFPPRPPVSGRRGCIISRRSARPGRLEYHSRVLNCGNADQAELPHRPRVAGQAHREDRFGPGLGDADDDGTVRAGERDVGLVGVGATSRGANRRSRRCRTQARVALGRLHHLGQRTAAPQPRYLDAPPEQPHRAAGSSVSIRP